MNRRTDDTSALEARAFSVPRRLAARRIIAVAIGKLEVSTHGGQAAHVRYLDTFDRCLRRAGLVLEHVAAPGAEELRLREFGRPTNLVDAPGAALPAFVGDISHARLRSSIAPLIEVRRLLVVAESRGRLTVARGRDGEGKTVLVLECFAAGRGPARLTVCPLRGYERFASRAIRRIRAVEGVEPDEREPLLAASGGPGAVFGGAAIPTPPDLDPDERSDAACRRLLAYLDAVMEANAPGIEADIDTECLHDFRVAVRRGRSLLREMKRVFPRSVARRLRADFGWLGQRTGALRDLDVQSMEIEAAIHDDPGATSSVDTAMHAYLAEARAREYRALCRTLRSARYRRVRASLRRFLESEPPARPRSENALVPIADLSAKRIRKVYRRILREGRAIRDDSPPESLHDLRKTCKRLRYLLEFFRGIHPAKSVERTIARLKRLQDNLGTYQDLQVQREVLRVFREHARASLDAAALRGIDNRCEALARREKKTRAEFAARFASYDSKPAHAKIAASLRRGSK